MSGGPFQPFLKAQGFVVLDGGLATALESAGHVLDSALWSARILLDEPAAVSGVHRAYLAAGADVITTAGYQASFEGFATVGLDRAAAEGALLRAVTVAVEARDVFWASPANRSGRLKPLVAASAGPYGAFLADGSEYDGRYGVPAATLTDFHGPRLDLLARSPADVLAVETIPSHEEARVLCALLSRSAKPAWISFTCRDEKRIRDGTPIEEAVASCVDVGAIVAVGVNCTHPAHVPELVGRIKSMTDQAVIAYPNSGEAYDAERGGWHGDRRAWIHEVPGWIDEGANVVGGCCRVGPAEIRELRMRLED